MLLAAVPIAAGLRVTITPAIRVKAAARSQRAVSCRPENATGASAQAVAKAANIPPVAVHTQRFCASGRREAPPAIGSLVAAWAPPSLHTRGSGVRAGGANGSPTGAAGGVAVVRLDMDERRG